MINLKTQDQQEGKCEEAKQTYVANRRHRRRWTSWDGGKAFLFSTQGKQLFWETQPGNYCELSTSSREAMAILSNKSRLSCMGSFL